MELEKCIVEKQKVVVSIESTPWQNSTVFLSPYSKVFQQKFAFDLKREVSGTSKLILIAITLSRICFLISNKLSKRMCVIAIKFHSSLR